MIQLLRSFAGLLIIGLLSGCVATVSPVPPMPPPRAEVVGVAPYPGAVWVQGSWGWHPRHHRYEWHGGHWQRHKH